MRIEAHIDYWKEGVLSFNPEKVILRLKKFFLQMETDWKDQTRINIERFFQNIKIKKLEPPDFIIEDQWRSFGSNAPTFCFKILTITNLEIVGYCNRWRIEFESESQFDAETEKIIIDFLKSLKYGEIKSDTQTIYFGEPDPDFPNKWLLADSE